MTSQQGKYTGLIVPARDNLSCRNDTQEVSTRTRGRFSKAHEKKVADQWDQPFGDKASITSSYMIL